MTITFPLPTELQGVGRVVGRFIVVTPDTVNDVDVYPEACGATGSVTFTPSTKLSKTADYAAFVGHPAKTFPVDAYGVMQDEELTGGVWLREDVYTVSYNLSGLNIASHTIEVTSGHTEEDPLVLSAAAPAELFTGSTLIMLQVPAGAVDGQLLSWSGTTGLVWVAQLDVSDASTTVKGIAELATNQETIDGTDPARVVTPAGVKAALDAKSVSDKSTYVAQAHYVRGTGSPYGSVTPASAGIEYVDTAQTNGARKWISTGTTNTSWEVTDGDTGWREISSWDTAGTVTGMALPTNAAPLSGAAGFVRTRRIGRMVYWSVRGLTVSTALATWNDVSMYDFLLNGPPYSRETEFTGTVYAALGYRTMIIERSASSSYPITIDAFYGVDVSGLTTRPWPTTLPGVAS